MRGNDYFFGKYNRVGPLSNMMFNVIFGLLAATALLPLLIVISLSFSSEQGIMVDGFSIIPAKFSLDAYRYVFRTGGSQLLHSYYTTVVITVLGVVCGLAINMSYAYAISIRNYRLRKLLLVIILIPMFINGGLVANYLVMTRILHLKNSVWAMVLPGLSSTFYIIILRTFIRTNVPDAIIESAKIDGASHYRIFFAIVLPMSLPALATIGLFITFTMWNEWFSALLYIDDPKKYPLQYLLIKIERDIQLVRELRDMGRISVSEEMEKTLPDTSLRMAFVVLAVTPIIFAYPFFQKYFVHGLTIGSIKG